MTRVLVIGRETSRVAVKNELWTGAFTEECACLRRLGDLAVNNLLQSVDALAIGAQRVLFNRVSNRVGRGVWCSLSRRGLVWRFAVQVTYHKMHPRDARISVVLDVVISDSSDRLQGTYLAVVRGRVDRVFLLVS